MKLLALLPLFMSTLANANLHLAPPDFEVKDGRSIFVDFQRAEYDITYDLRARRTTVKTKISFVSKSTGRPMFDLRPTPKNIILNGSPVRQRLTSFPGNSSKLRILNEEVSPGEHVLEMENEFSANVSYNQRSVSSAFWIRDLKDRMFLEQYIPSNFEFDQYPIVLNISIKGIAEAHQDIFANGSVTKTSLNSWRIEFPKYYTVSSPYFHMIPKGATYRMDFTYDSVDGRKLPITVYSPIRERTEKFARETVKYMRELEADYGPWPHPSFIAYGTLLGIGGMEHAGATATSLAALDHEMLHSYFAKGLMPANGNAGWIDEAIASWRDFGYQRNPVIAFKGSNIGGHSVYKRNTDKRSYKLGRAFMAYLDFKLQHLGGLKSYLKGYAQAYMHTVITTEHFKNNLEFFSGINFDREFQIYIWGEGDGNSGKTEDLNPHHRELSEDQLLGIL